MNPKEILSIEEIADVINNILVEIHTKGPISEHNIEILSYFKIYRQDEFDRYENQLIYLLGLFYKTQDPTDLVGFVYRMFAGAIQRETGHVLTPVQAAIRKGILEDGVYSFSAPTSAGKSFLLRALLEQIEGDTIIVVPSRALIAEYLMLIRDKFVDEKDVLILQSIDNINRLNTRKRIFVVTPERATELFRLDHIFNIKFVLYDEAQISEDDRRGILFDFLVRKIQQQYPEATKVFAHPFVQNPEAQLEKHNLSSVGGHAAFSQQTVGKIFFEVNEEDGTFWHFSPYIDGSHLKKNKLTTDEDVPLQILQRGGTMLIYTSKTSIYTGAYINRFSKYIDQLLPIQDAGALAMIDQIENLIGAKRRDSKLVKMMKIGVVVHHGSMPLNVRYLIESFTNSGFARICFATSTLAHGVNMPFDLVWLDSMRFEGDEDDKRLALRNLIGRSGRSRSDNAIFDVGYVVVKNSKLFTERVKSNIELSPISKLDDETTAPDDLKEFVDAIKNEDMDNELHIPNSRAERLRSPEVLEAIETLINLLYSGDTIISGDKYNTLPGSMRDEIKNAFQFIFSEAVGRDLQVGERGILSTAITILLWQIQGKSFKEIMALRYYYLTCQQKKKDLKNKLKKNTITEREYRNALAELTVAWSAIPEQLPNLKLFRTFPRFNLDPGNTSIDYDLLVYDTYDYLDKVISFSLSDIYYAAFVQYFNAFSDYKAMDMANFFRYGTRDEKEIMLLRYGFSFEDIELIRDHVRLVNEDKIEFRSSIADFEDTPIMELVSRYIL